MILKIEGSVRTELLRPSERIEPVLPGAPGVSAARFAAAVRVAEERAEGRFANRTAVRKRYGER